MEIDENKFRELWYKMKHEDIEKAVRRGSFIPEADHTHHHKWVASRIEFRKKLFRRILWGFIAAIFTVGAGIYVSHYQENRKFSHGQIAPDHIHPDHPHSGN